MHTPHGVYKRLQRYDRDGGARYLTFSCFHDLPLFTSDDAKRAFVEALGWVRQRYDLRLWAWVVMPTHTHIIIVRKPDDPLMREIVAQLKGRVANHVLKAMREHSPEGLTHLRDSQHKERFWQRGGGYDRNLCTFKGIWNAIEYIHLNPVRAGLCRLPADWAWSSARAYAERSASPLPIDFDSLPHGP